MITFRYKYWRTLFLEPLFWRLNWYKKKFKRFSLQNPVKKSDMHLILKQPKLFMKTKSYMCFYHLFALPTHMQRKHTHTSSNKDRKASIFSVWLTENHSNVWKCVCGCVWVCVFVCECICTKPEPKSKPSHWVYVMCSCVCVSARERTNQICETALGCKQQTKHRHTGWKAGRVSLFWDEADHPYGKLCQKTLMCLCSVWWLHKLWSFWWNFLEGAC